MIKQIWNWIIEFKIASIIKNEKIDIVHINVGSTSLGAKSAIKLKKPLIWHLREFLEEDVNLTYINPNKTIKFMKKADAVIAISDAVSNHFSEKYSINNITTIYNGILFKKTLDVKKINTKNQVNLSIIGRIVPTKGQLDAVKALLELKRITNKDFILNIIGDVGHDGYYKEIRTFISENKLEDKVNIISHKSNLTESWEKTDIGLVCSTKEGFGRVTAEFMLNGIPVVGANTGATPELLKDGKGFIYEYNNTKSLVDQILQAISDPDKTRDIANRAKEYAENEFTSEHCADRVLAIYKKVLYAKEMKK